MSILDRILGESPAEDTNGAALADGDMRKVIETYLDLGGKPIETLSADEARKQPSITDAVMKILRERGREDEAGLGVHTHELTIPGAAGPLQARLYHPGPDTQLRPLVVYFHGGGFVLATLDSYDATPRAIAKMADVAVLSVHYRQAPEHPFPAAHDDALAAYRWALDNAQSIGADPRRIAVMGESAGGNLAIGVAMAARDQGLPAPAHMALIYPVAGADMTTESYRENETAQPLNKAMMQWFVKQALQSPSDLSDPRIDVVNADLAGLPSATVVTAEIDPLRSEGELLAERLEAAGSDVHHKTFHGVTHEFFGMGLLVKDALHAEHMVAHDLKKALHDGHGQALI